MEKILLFHGSERIIESPVFGYKNGISDYGPGFYCTQDSEAAKEWANRRTDKGYVNQYSFDARNLKILDLTNGQYSVLHWITLLLKNRILDEVLLKTYKKEFEYLYKHYDLDISSYDVIVGYRADDAYFKFPLSFIRSEITLETLIDIYSLGDLGKQVVIISEKTFRKLKFIKALEADYSYKQKYLDRLHLADRRFNELIETDRYSNKERLIDLVRRELND